MSSRLHWFFWTYRGVCHWCGIECVLPKHCRGIKPLPKNMATLDHLYSRLNPERTSQNRKEVVLSCIKCNKGRAIQETKVTFKAEQIRRTAEGVRKSKLSL